jgi:hypothetical protein
LIRALLILLCLLAFDLGLFGEQLLAVLKDGNSWVPTGPDESGVLARAFHVVWDVCVDVAKMAPSWHRQDFSWTFIGKSYKFKDAPEDRGE